MVLHRELDIFYDTPVVCGCSKCKELKVNPRHVKMSHYINERLPKVDGQVLEWVEANEGFFNLLDPVENWKNRHPSTYMDILRYVHKNPLSKKNEMYEIESCFQIYKFYLLKMFITISSLIFSNSYNLFFCQMMRYIYVWVQPLSA